MLIKERMAPLLRVLDVGCSSFSKCGAVCPCHQCAPPWCFEGLTVIERTVGVDLCWWLEGVVDPRLYQPCCRFLSTIVCWACQCSIPLPTPRCLITALSRIDRSLLEKYLPVLWRFFLWWLLARLLSPSPWA